MTATDRVRAAERTEQEEEDGSGVVTAPEEQQMKVMGAKVGLLQLDAHQQETLTSPIKPKQWKVVASDEEPQDETLSDRKTSVIDSFEKQEIPSSVMKRAHTVSIVPAKGRGGVRSATLTRSQSCPARDAALRAIETREPDFHFSTSERARDVVREMHSFRINSFPAECYCSAELEWKKRGLTWRKYHAELDREGFWCWKNSKRTNRKRKQFRISSDDLVAVEQVDGHELVIYFMRPGKGINEKRLNRRYKTIRVRFGSEEEAEKWTHAIRSLVRWFARVPEGVTRRIKVVVNPYSGKKKGRKIWRKWSVLFRLAGIECDMEETRYRGHARDIGAAYDLSKKYEAIVFIGGDGTVNEFLNGVFSRGEEDWRRLVATTPVSLLCGGTDNAFGTGVGTPTHEAAVYCVIRRKIRPMDVIACEGTRPDGSAQLAFACCGINYGIGSDIAMESEQTRYLGVYRYLWLKVKRGVLAPRRHDCRVKYVVSESIPTDDDHEQLLQTFYDADIDGTSYQHHIELCNVYDENAEKLQQWEGDSSSIFRPCSEEKYAGKWVSEEGNYTMVGASNVYMECPFSHPSDGNMDLIRSRRGNPVEMADVTIKYLTNRTLESKLMLYRKVKAMVVEPIDNNSRLDPINVDGELLETEDSFRFEIIPNLLCVLSEK